MTHLESFPEERDEIIGVLNLPRDETPQEKVAELIRRFRDAGTLNRVLQRISSEAESATKQIEELKQPELARLLDELVTRVSVPISHLMSG